MSIELKQDLSGHYRVQVLNSADRSVKTDTGWFRNLITTSGLNHIGKTVNTLFQRCYVGTSNQVPAMSDTALIALLATLNKSSLSPALTYNATDQYYQWEDDYEFATGAVVGNVAEVGIGPNDGADLTIFSRALIKDSGGLPTTITVLSDEILRVFFQFRVYIDVTDQNFISTIEGVSRTCVMRPASMATSTAYANIGTNVLVQTTGAVLPSAYSGSLGTINAIPTGTVSNTTNVSAATYTAGSFYRDLTISFTTTQGNIVGGVAAIAFNHSHGAWQVSFSPVLDKTNLKIMSFTFRVSWANRP